MIGREGKQVCGGGDVLQWELVVVCKLEVGYYLKHWPKAVSGLLLEWGGDLITSRQQTPNCERQF